MHSYLDDFLIKSNESENLNKFTAWIIEKFKYWGIQINEKKSILISARQVKFLGYEITKTMVKIPKIKCEEIKFNV